jgi:hypothetical protein
MNFYIYMFLRIESFKLAGSAESYLILLQCLEETLYTENAP